MKYKYIFIKTVCLDATAMASDIGKNWVVNKTLLLNSVTVFSDESCIHS